MAKSSMNPKTLQYLMGHSDIGVTVNLSKGHTPQSSHISITMLPSMPNADDGSFGFMELEKMYNKCFKKSS